MTEALLLLVTAAAFAFGYYVIKKIDAFMEENNRLFASMDARESRCVRIAAENPMFFDAVAPALAHISDSNPDMEVRLSSAHAKHLLRRLCDGSIDIALLSEENAKPVNSAFGCTLIPACTDQKAVTVFGLPVDNADDQRIVMVWNKTLSSKDRDRVLFALENEHLSFECGSCESPA